MIIPSSEEARVITNTDRNREFETINNLNTRAGDILVLRDNGPRKKIKHSMRNNQANLKKNILEKKSNRLRSQKTLFSMYSEDEEINKEQKKTFRQILNRILSTNKRKELLKIVISIISLGSFLLYVMSTYLPFFFKYLNYIDYIVCFIYFIDYAVNFILVPHHFNFFISNDSLIDLITMIPPFLIELAGEKDSLLLDFINVSRVLKAIRFFRIFTIYKTGENDVNKQIMMIINTLILMILITSGIMQIVERKGVEIRLSLAQDIPTINHLRMQTNFHHYIYFIVVTIATVGYGDIIPKTTIGQFIIMALVLLTLVLIPKQTNDLIQLMSAQSEYARRSYKASKDVSHIILTGDITIDALKSFCQELFHPDHGSQYKHAVIINSSLPSREMEIFLNEKGNDIFLFYLQGDPMNEKDLLRADISKARSCVIFNNKSSHDPYSSDHQSLLLGLYIKKFVYNYNLEASELTASGGEITAFINSNFRLCLQLIKPESKYHYFTALQNVYKKCMPPDQIIIIEAIKMNILSKSCLTPGIMALISNLVMSCSEMPRGIDTEWLKEYYEGRGHEIYRIQLSDTYKKMTFLELVNCIYNQAQAIVFALEIEVNGIALVKLNPCTNLTILDMINKVKVGEKDKLNSSKDKERTFMSEDQAWDDRVINVNDHKVRVYAYLICSDKTVANDLANKDKEKEKKLKHSNQNKVTAMNKIVSQNQKIISTYIRTATQIEEESDNDSDNSKDNEYNTLNGIDDLEICYDDYYINTGNNKFITSNSDIMHHTIKDREDISNHILICGVHPALIHFILPLRAKYLGEDNLKYIVILAPTLPQHLYDAFTKFPKIIFIQGSPLLPENLYRANIMNADKAVILSSGESKVSKSTINMKLNTSINPTPYEDFTDEGMLDAETIFIYKAIKKCNKTIQIMTELVSTRNIEYLLQKNFVNKMLFVKELFPLYEFAPVFAAGEVFTPSIIDRITCQSYYNPHILTIIEQLLSGGMKNKNKKYRRLEEDLGVVGSNLFLSRVPEAYVNESFGDLFEYLTTSHHVVAIAIYRKNILEDFYYVYTNPKKTTLLREHDLVFVLGHEINVIDLFEDRMGDGNGDKDEKENQQDNSDSIIEEFTAPEVGIRDRAKEGKSILSLERMNTLDLKKFKSEPLSLSKRHENVSTEFKSPSRRKSQKRQGVGVNTVKEYKEDKKPESSKYYQIEKIKQRLEQINKSLNYIRNSYDRLPDEIENFISQEIDNEFMMYLNKYR